jgi:uncharacterized protein (TIGR00251 family)
MKVSVIVKPNSRKTAVTQLAGGEYQVAVQAPPRDGKANLAVIEALARHFDVPRSSVRITHGHGGRKKLVTID